MLLHLLYTAYGVGDWAVALFMGPPSGITKAHAVTLPKPPSLLAKGWALLIVGAFVLLLAFIAPLAVPGAAKMLQPGGASGLLWAAGGLLAALSLWLALTFVRFLGRCHRHGRDIYHGLRRPSWQR